MLQNARRHTGEAVARWGRRLAGVWWHEVPGRYEAPALMQRHSAVRFRSVDELTNFLEALPKTIDPAVGTSGMPPLRVTAMCGDTQVDAAYGSAGKAARAVAALGVVDRRQLIVLASTESLSTNYRIVLTTEAGAQSEIGAAGVANTRSLTWLASSTSTPCRSTAGRGADKNRWFRRCPTPRPTTWLTTTASVGAPPSEAASRAQSPPPFWERSPRSEPRPLAPTAIRATRRRRSVLRSLGIDRSVSVIRLS
ncbi:hypothetical protein ACFUMH_08450 [Cellulomonas sp. NPDC057328]|uniref:hypothetical protein n=1 Tax=Cellulomonas sp. NPDC057328 TaxID=3346101 RepID=UPI0036332B63